MFTLLRNWFRNASQAAPATTVAPVVTTQSAARTPPVANNQLMDIQSATAALDERDRRSAEGLARLSSNGRADWPPVYADPFPGMASELPEIPAKDLTVDILGGAVAHHGALVIRGLLTPAQVAATREMQDRVRALSLSGKPDDSGWYVPFKAVGSPRLPGLRKRIQGNGGNWLVDSPLGLQQTLEMLETAGVLSVIAAHFGERPVVSLQKCTLRTIAPRANPTGWHQDGSFLGEKVRSMNLWVALNECGGSTPAPGMEIIPARLEEIYHIPPDLGATEQALELVQPLVDQYSLAVPEFAPGDAIMFDEKLMHRTAFGPHLSEIRYALECWFFAPSHSTESYAPLLA